MTMMIQVKCAAFALLCAVASPTTAQEVLPCDWQSSAGNVVEPWEDNSRTFANGDIRVAFLDTIEPAVGFAYLLVLTPSDDELGGNDCAVIGYASGMGFAGLTFDSLQSGYEPGQGLGLTVQVKVFDPATSDFRVESLGVIINQASGAITASLVADDK